MAIILPSDVDPQLKTELRKCLESFAVVKEIEGTSNLTEKEKKSLSHKLAAFLMNSEFTVLLDLIMLKLL